MTSFAVETPAPVESDNRFEQRLRGVWRWIFFVFSAAAVLLAVNQVFTLKLFGFLPIEVSYLYYLLGLYLPLSYLMYPARKSDRTIRWYDVLCFLAAVGINFYFGAHGLRIVGEGWDWSAPPLATAFSVLLWLLVLESLRRSAGFWMALICAIFSIYPLVAGVMPGIFKGQSYTFLEAARQHALSVSSILGLPLQTVGNLLIGFMLFAVVLHSSGAGTFFYNLTGALVGRTRGGPGKVATVASGLFGMLSGSGVANVLTTGSMTIPAMKRAGFPPYYAAAIEACAATGGAIMPPIMGAAAFVMATFLNIPYAEVALAAAIPAVLYYWSIFVAVDAFAARAGLASAVHEELPSLRETFKQGWYYVFALFVLVYLTFQLRVEALAPYYTSVLLLLLAALRKETRLNWTRFRELIENAGKTLVELVSILAGVGLIVGGVSITGVALAFSRELVAAVGDNSFLILLAGAVTSFILGTGMTATTCYIFLAIVMAPALVELGIDPVAAHLFVLYWGILSDITPPTAFSVYTAAGLAGSNPNQTAWTAVRMSTVRYILPFLFAYNPALIGHATPWAVAQATITALIGVWLLASGMEGYLSWVGVMPNLLLRVGAVIGGLLMTIPAPAADVVGGAVAAATVAGTVVVNRAMIRAKEAGRTPASD